MKGAVPLLPLVYLHDMHRHNCICISTLLSSHSSLSRGTRNSLVGQCPDYEAMSRCKLLSHPCSHA